VQQYADQEGSGFSLQQVSDFYLIFFPLEKNIGL
jgi:hypothetical protein